MKRIISIFALISIVFSAFADWHTHFAYTNVTQIALGTDCVYGLSDGSLFSVDKQTEKIKIWTKQNGMYSSGIWMIGFDEVNETLLAIYPTGQIDLIKGENVLHLSDFANKDMTASKRTNNITFHNGRAYLSCEFGIVSFDVKKHEFVDVYYIGPEAKEVNVEDIVIQDDSIFAFSKDKIYRTSLKKNASDFRNWQTEPLSKRIPRDTDKRQKYLDNNNDLWAVGGYEGIVRRTATGERIAYLPNGPATNTPYRLKFDNGRLYMLSGGRWAVQYFRPGNVMIFEDGKWTNLTQDYIQSKTGKPAMDFMNVAVDPRNKDHFYVTSYGTGLYEFAGKELIAHHTPDNSTITAILPNHPDTYTRCDGATFDNEANLMLVVTSHAGPEIPIRLADGTWTGINLFINGQQLQIETPGEILLDNRNPKYKFIPYCRDHPGIIVLDDNGTLTDESDDRCVIHSIFTDQDGAIFNPTSYYVLCQSEDGTKWIGTNEGVMILPADIDYITSNTCRRLHIPTDNGDWLMENDEVNAISFDEEGNVWCGTTAHGVYVLSADGSQLLQHYTSENSIMPSDKVMSLAYDTAKKRMYIGTGNGLVSYSDQEMGMLEEPSSNTGAEDKDSDADYGSMNHWTLHPAYANVTHVAASQKDIFALSDGALFSINRTDESIAYYDRLNGLSSTNIQFISYNETTQKLLIVYQNGMMDILDSKGNIQTLSDLFLKGEKTEMSINEVLPYQQYEYLAMSFGIIKVDLQRQEINDTYYIGEDASNVDVLHLAISTDTLYAVTEEYLYAGALTDNLIDYSQWKVTPLPESKTIQGLAVADNQLYMLRDSILYRYDAGGWKPYVNDTIFWVRSNRSRLLAGAQKGLAEISEGKVTYLTDAYSVSDAVWSNGEYWLAACTQGVIRYSQNSFQQFLPNGPLSNLSYRLQFVGDRLMVAQGGRWAYQYNRSCDVIWYDYTGKQWGAIPADYTMWYLQHGVFDVMNYAVDPANSNHFFATTYGTGLIEFLDGRAVKMYNEQNSTLRSAIDEDTSQSLVRTDGALYDRYGNLWVLNAGTRASAINILSPQGIWYKLDLRSGGQRVTLSTPGLLLADSKYPNSKWLYDCRETQGVMVIDDGGTPFDPTDDHMLKRTAFVDQIGRTVEPAAIYCMTQDHSGSIWVGTEAGLFIIESVETFLASNACSRVIISRNDGTDLADYLLKEEQINAICVDGGNRKWIGTANSGLYLVSSDGKETIHHFTINNSPLPSNYITSIAIHPISGEVFIGTSGGLVSFQSDAAEAAESFEGIYAYPNPVRPNYQGVITISGLMDNTIVTIIDGGGNVVCRTRSNGSIAIWDGKNAQGKRVTTGVYTVLCNTADGENHTVTKILVTH